jgi:ABC-type transport system involved in multi-copper enzyme maturation permease subunit
MRNLISAEVLKLRTMRLFWATVLAALAFVPVSIELSLHTISQPGGQILDSPEGVRNVISAASSGSLTMLVMGILMMAGEFRHGTATGTFLAQPDRRRVILAKLTAATVTGIAVAAAASIVTLTVALPWLSSQGVSASSYGQQIALAVAGAFAATAIGGLVGVGIGALLPNQTLAVTVTLIWTLTLEALLVGLTPEVGRWLPGGAASSLSGTATQNGGMLPMWAGALVLAGYGLAFAAAGAHIIQRRDIT